MPKLRYIILLLLLLTLTSARARTAADFFLDMPNKHLPLLDRNTRLDMLDYFNAGLETASKTGLGGQARILSNHPDRILMQVSRDATVEIAVVKTGNDTIVALIETVKTPIHDSSITLMNKDYSNPRSIEMPGVEMMAGKDNIKALKDMPMPEMIFISASFDPDNNAFVFTDNTTEYYPADELPEAAKLMRKQVHGVVKNDRFVELKRR